MQPSSSSGNNNSNNAAAGNPWLNYYQQWSERTPYVTRFTTVSLCFLYILSFFVPLDSYLGNMPFFTIQHFEIYRLLLSPLVGNSILSLIIILLSYPTMAQRMENSSGSAAFLSLLLIFTLAINVLVTIICYIFFILSIFPEAIFWRSSGFFSIFFALLTVECMMVCEHLFS